MGTRTRNIAIIFSLLALAGAAGCFFLFSIIKNNIEKVQEIKSATEKSIAEKDKEDELASLLEDVKRDISSLESRIIDADNAVLFIEEIELLGRSAGARISIDSVAVDPIEKGNVEYLALSISAEGSWSQVFTFLKMFELLPYKVSVDSVGFSQTIFSQSPSLDDKDKKLVEHKGWRGKFEVKVLKKK